MKENLLFVCMENEVRSPAAEKLLCGHPRYNVKSCGLSKNANIKISQAAIDWADKIFVMEKLHETTITHYLFPYAKKEVLNLDIHPHLYGEELNSELRVKLKSYLS